MTKRIIVLATALVSASTLSSATTADQTLESSTSATAQAGELQVVARVPTVGIKARAITNAKVVAPVAVCSESTKFSGGPVTADRTLTKECSPYTITTDITVDGSATLTIAPGVTVRFAPATTLSVGKTTAAKLVAVGTATDPIELTSSSSTPRAGDWTGVQLLSKTLKGTALGYLKLDYCGSRGGIGSGCLVSFGLKPYRVVVDHVTFAHVGAGSDAILQKDADSTVTISNCTFNDVSTTPTQQYAISVNAQSFSGIDNTNTFNGSMIELRGGLLSLSTAWKNVGAVVAVTYDIEVGGTPTPTLSIAAGSRLKFARDTGIGVGYDAPGKLVLAGTATNLITLTSLAASQGPGDWSGIRVGPLGQATVNATRISYGGSDQITGTASGNVVVEDGAKLTIANSILSESAGYGVWVKRGSRATITTDPTVQYENNASGAIGPGPS